MQHDDLSVPGTPQVDLDHIRPLLHGEGESWQRVLAGRDRIASVGDGQRHSHSSDTKWALSATPSTPTAPDYPLGWENRGT